jgi:deazaflavin-dependent oxidoreductase (nitroreductase family)
MRTTSVANAITCLGGSGESSLNGLMATEASVAHRLAPQKDRGTLQLTTLGRKTGKRHTVTVWFLVDGETLYLVTMNMRRDWPRNMMKNGAVDLKIDGSVFRGHARQIRDSKRLGHVNKLLREKYWAAWLGSWVGLGPAGAFTVTIGAESRSAKPHGLK